MHFPSQSRARWVGGRRWRLSRRRQLPRKVAFLFPLYIIWGRKLYPFFQGKVFHFSLLVDMLVARREPTACNHDAYLVGTRNWAFWEKGWQKHGKTMISPFLWTYLLGEQKNYLFFGRFFYGFFLLVGPGILGLALVLLFLVNFRLSSSMSVGV